MSDLELQILRELVEYARQLEEELYGDDSGEGPAIVAANSLLAEYEG